MWKERARGDLAFELRGPSARNRLLTSRTLAIGRQAIVFDEIAVPTNQSFIASWTAGVFPLAHHTGKISGIDVAESSITADFSGTEQVLHARVTLIVHFVVGVKCGHMPGYVGRDARKELGEAAEFVG